MGTCHLQGAYATNDPAYCEFTPKGDVNFCRNVLVGGEPTVYQTGYLNATVDQIELDSSDQGIATLSNGCKIEVADEGGWRLASFELGRSAGSRLRAGDW